MPRDKRRLIRLLLDCCRRPVRRGLCSWWRDLVFREFYRISREPAERGSSRYTGLEIFMITTRYFCRLGALLAGTVLAQYSPSHPSPASGAKSGSKYAVVDCHLHFLNFVQETAGMD